ncbi:MAG: ATP-binding cassette domain-containing protein [Coriobacteriaceae bacterium]
MLEGRHLSVAFDGRPVLDDVSLAVASGERVQLAAPSGTGKTTLCRVLAGYLARTGSARRWLPAAGRGPCSAAHRAASGLR